MAQFWYRFKYRYGQHLFLTKPVDVSLELASLCNQACVYCYHADQKTLPFSKRFMPFSLAEKIIFEAADLGVNSLKFNYRGESTLNPDFKQITDLAKMLAKGAIFIDRITNSNFKFHNDRYDIFDGLCNQTKVKISFDSFQKKVFETQRKGAIYELALANIDKFYNWPRRKDTEIVIQAVRTTANKDEDIYGEVKKRWPSATVSIRDMVSGRIWTDLSELENRKRDTSERQSCLQAHVRLIIGSNGEAYPCCPSIDGSLKIGDTTYQSLGEIFNSVAALKLRRALKNKTAFSCYNSCKNCASFETYKGFKAPWGS